MALWRLPRPDFHRLVDTDFQDTPLTLWPDSAKNERDAHFRELFRHECVQSNLLFKIGNFTA